jgi:hypothetical protein
MMKTLHNLLAFFLVLAIPGFLDVRAYGADERAPVPKPEEIGKAEQLVKEVFGGEYAKTSPAARAALAAKLWKQAEQTKDDPVGRYVLLRDARDFAAKGGDPLTAGKAADALADEYRLGPGAARAPMAAPLATAPLTPDNARAAADVLISGAEAAAAGDEWDDALALLKSADVVARKAKNFALANKVKTQLSQVEKGKAAATQIEEQVAALKANPDDPAANLAVGRYLCLVKHEWDAALPHLVKGATGRLKEAVDKDLKAAESEDVEAQLAAADAWYDLAGRSPADTKAVLQARAHHWYLLALPKAAGLGKAKAEKRVEELQAASESAGDMTRVWTFIRKALADGKLKRCEIVGGAFAQNTFEELPQGGAILIGFRYTTKDGGRFPNVIQPIFLTAGGEVFGKVYGIPERGVPVQIAKAKPGYAVGALFVRGGGGFDAFQPIFMRVKGNGLDITDRYEGPYVGGQGGGSRTLGGDGNFIVGVHGKINDKGKMETMSPVLLSVPVPAESATPPVAPRRGKSRR